MAREIERKFLIADDSWRGLADRGRAIVQAYLCQTDLAVVRLRIVNDAAAFLTVKSAEAGLSRAEFEYAVPTADAQQMMTLRQASVVEKLRHHVSHAGRVWEVDVYSGDNEGLVIAEVELESEAAPLDLPSWIGDEVTGDARYYASRLAQEPFGAWPEQAGAMARRVSLGR